MSGIERIRAERQRQIDSEGWTPEHDDAHTTGDLAVAASCYAWKSQAFMSSDTPPALWPWGRPDWKPSDDPIRNLEKAGALIAAEIDRLERTARDAP